ncbi:protein dbl-1-like [Watersipora subatra]|uniref:protein dbl-1-like n=1 Tax=Watersipora subatra TaxID=2589382 RepID=UPI00355C7DB9
MKGHVSNICYLLFTILHLSFHSTSGNTFHSRAEAWGVELTGESEEAIVTDTERESYKQNLLQYVFRTEAPTSAQLNTDGAADVPFVMNKIYELLADRDTGREKRSTPFDVDLIRGFQDHWETERRMQFWFNTTAVNETEDIIEAYFHIYKRRAIRPGSVALGSHTVTVGLYKVVDENNLYTPDGKIGAGAILIQRQQVSAYSAEWIIFKGDLKDLVKDWIRNPASNKGFLVSATDPDDSHVNGTHIDFIQRGEHPRSRQPVFVVYTDQERKKNNKSKRKQRTSIDFLVDNFLNEDVRREQQLRELCRTQFDSQENSMEECTTVVFRQRRSLLNDRPENNDEDDESEESDEEWEDDGNRRRRRLREQGDDLAIEATRRTNNFCQKKPLYVSFRALGWGKWIVAPEGLNANYCDGQCPFPLTSTLTTSNHAVLQSVSNYYFPDKVKAPCCVPQKLQRMSILYHQTDKVVAMKNYDNIIVDTCGCR